VPFLLLEPTLLLFHQAGKLKKQPIVFIRACLRVPLQTLEGSFLRNLKSEAVRDKLLEAQERRLRLGILTEKIIWWSRGKLQSGFRSWRREPGL